MNTCHIAASSIYRTRLIREMDSIMQGAPIETLELSAATWRAPLPEAYKRNLARVPKMLCDLDDEPLAAAFAR